MAQSLKDIFVKKYGSYKTITVCHSSYAQYSLPSGSIRQVQTTSLRVRKAFFTIVPKRMLSVTRNRVYQKGPSLYLTDSHCYFCFFLSSPLSFLVLTLALFFLRPFKTSLSWIGLWGMEEKGRDIASRSL